VKYCHLILINTCKETLTNITFNGRTLGGLDFGGAALSSTLDYFTNFFTAPRNNIADHYVTLVTGGAVLAFDDQVHIDLDRSHTVLSPTQARQFAAELKRIADMIDSLSEQGRGE
jgi:hypothetical protein